MTTPEACLALTTCPTLDEAEKIAEALVSERLAACVNVLNPASPVKSFYEWEGRLQTETEYLLLIKTRLEKLQPLEERIHALHSYTVPELIVLPVTQGSQAYLSWVRQQVE